MYEILVGAGIVFGYVFVGAVVGAIAYRIDRDVEWAQMVGALWPISLPLIALIGTVYGTVCLVKNAKMPSLPKRKTAEQKVIEYSQSPVKVLTEIICAKILAEPENLKWIKEIYSGGRYTWNWSSSDSKLTVKCSNYYRDDPIGRVSSVKVGDKTINIEEEAVLKALNKAKKLNEEKAKADAEAAKQLAALEAVELLLLQPEKANDQITD